MTPLRQRMLEDMQLRGLAERTKESYRVRCGGWRSTMAGRRTSSVTRKYAAISST